MDNLERLPGKGIDGSSQSLEKAGRSHLSEMNMDSCAVTCYVAGGLWWAHHTGLCQAKQQVGHITPTPHTCAEKYQCMICTPAVCTNWCYIEAGIRVVMNSCTEGQQILVTERVV